MKGAGELEWLWIFKNGRRKMWKSKTKCQSAFSTFHCSLAFLFLFFVLVSSSESELSLSSYGSYSDSARIPTLHRCCPPGSSYSFRTYECIKSSKTTKVVLQSDSDSASDIQNSREITTAIPNINVNSSDNNSSVYKTDDGVASSSASEFDLSDSSILSVAKSSLLLVHEYDHDNDINSDNNNNSFKRDETVQFKLMPRSQSPKCSKGNFTVQINIKMNSSENESEKSSTSIVKLTSMGLLRIGDEYYSTPEYCLAGLEGDRLTILVCNATCGAGTPCIRKCCDLNEVWDQSRGGRQQCAPAGQHQWNPIFYSDHKRKAGQDIIESLHPHYEILHPRRFCNPAVYKATVLPQTDPHGNPYTTFRVLTNGEIIRRLTRYSWNTTVQPREFYCADGRINPPLPPDNSQQPLELSYSGNNERDSILFDCGPEDKQEEGTSMSILYAVVMIFSCVFLLLTLLVYILLWEKQNVHGWTLMCYATSLFFMYLFFVFMYFSELTLVQDYDGNAGTFCYITAVGLNFFFLSTFCWMSMINFDLFTTFKALKPTAGRSKGLKRFMAYACFSLVVPISIVTVALSLDKIYGLDADSGIIVPEYGRRRCQLDPEYAQLVYAYGPAGVLLMFNLIFFTITVYTMYQLQQVTKFATESSSKNKQQKQSMRLFAKLLFVMGFPWIFEVISWAVEHNRLNGTQWYWVIFDLINILQAIAIFYIFVCKKDIIHSLEQKYPPFKKFLNRILLDSETAEKITGNHPKLKGFIKPFTRRTQEVTSNCRSMTNTETTNSTVNSSYPDSVRRDTVINLQTRKQQSTVKHSKSTT